MEKGGSKMKKLFFGTMLLALACVVPLPAIAQVYDDVPFGPPTEEPPPYEFETPPDMMPLPYAEDVYAAPYADLDLFFWNGWWWRLWQNQWYRSYYYDRGWEYYPSVPTFYYDVGPRWRGHYGNHAWYGNHWGYNGIDRERQPRNWQNWRTDRRQEREQTWGAPNYQHRQGFQAQEPRQQRYQQHQQRTEAQYYQQRRLYQQRQPQPMQSYQTRPQRQHIPNIQQQPRFQSQQPRQHYQARPQMRERAGIQQRLYSRPQGRNYGGRS